MSSFYSPSPSEPVRRREGRRERMERLKVSPSEFDLSSLPPRGTDLPRTPDIPRDTETPSPPPQPSPHTSTSHNTSSFPLPPPPPPPSLPSPTASLPPPCSLPPPPSSAANL